MPTIDHATDSISRLLKDEAQREAINPPCDELPVGGKAVLGEVSGHEAIFCT